jgi:(p)ppGpp synthase/HD superfamily hydrolase
MSWSQNNYVKALNFASDYHINQLVPGTVRPYETHLAKVAMEVMAALPHHPGANADFAVLCAILHDTIEDTAADYATVLKAFGEDVANGVLALTKDFSLPKSEQMPDSLDRILKQPPEVAMVKMADRITNLAPPPDHWTVQKCLTYQEEARFILNKLGHVSNFLADRLQQKIDEYPIPA